MKRCIKLWIVALIFCIIPVLVLLIPKMSSGGKSRVIEPVKYSKEVTLETRGKKNFYYHLDSSAPLSVVIDGPAILKIITRLDFSELSKKSVPYAIYIALDNGSPIVYPKKSKVSVLSKYVSSDEKSLPGKGRNIFIKVPEGKHTYTLSLNKGTKYTLKVRFISKK